MEVPKWFLAYGLALIALLAITSSTLGVALAISHNNQQSCDLQLPTL